VLLQEDKVDAQLPQKPIDAFLIAGTNDDVVERYRTLAERAKTKRFGLLERDYVVIDTETTGLHDDEDELIEIAAAVVNGPEVVKTFQTFVDPGRPIPEFITELTSIADSDVSGAPSPEEAVEMLDEFVDGRLLIAHNARFDRGFISRYSDPDSVLSRRECWIDTLGLSRIALPRLVAHDQATMCDAFGVGKGNHRADGDVRALCELWRIMLTALDDMPHELIGFISKMAPGGPWPIRDILIQIAGEDGERNFSMYALRDKQIVTESNGSSDLIDPENNVLDFKPVEREDVERAFSADGVVGKMYPKFERRPEQVEFALDVSDAFYTSTHRVIEAGTGVGKSISYLLPAVMFAKRNHVRVGVATKTNTLLDQLVFKELPTLRKAMREVEGIDFSYIALKGYDHYPCLRKLMRFARDMDGNTSEYDIVTTASIITSVSQSVWGDLDSLSLSLSHVARGNIVCSSEECMFGKCGYYPNRCLLHGARKKANNCEIVVTNHALLFRDVSIPKGVLPPIRYWVVDEAHGVEDEARKQFSHSVDSSDMSSYLHKLGSATGPLKQIEQRALVIDGGSALLGLITSVETDLKTIESSTSVFFQFVELLSELESRSSYSSVDIWINKDRRETPQWQAVLDSGTALLGQLDKMISDMKNALSMTEQFDELAEQETELSSAISRLSEMLEAISLVLDGSDDRYFYFADISFDRNGSSSLTAALVDLGSVLAEQFFPETNSVILTSATVAVGKSFDYFANRIGLDRLEPGMWEACHLDPSEGFYANMRTLVVDDLPDPRSDGYIDSLCDLVIDVHLGLGGGVLTLFTNKREMLTVYERVYPILKENGVDLLCQSAGKSKRKIRDDFTNDEDACLFATKSFWEGFDAPGRTLRCVLLPKLPFARPNDPLNQERNARQDNAWKSFVLPQAVIDTKQAAGRLIRSKSDSGFLILCDCRLRTMWYGKIFMRAFPKDTVEVVSAEDVRQIMESSQL
jgi:ATP-dependent DNA helicase DinG